MCLGCGSLQVSVPHPLFHGGLCTPCKNNFLEVFFLYDEDGSQSFCAVCCAGERLVICEDPSCARCYCLQCLDALLSPGSALRVLALDWWICFLCLPEERHGVLQRREGWRGHIKRLYDREAGHFGLQRPVSPWKRLPILVLSLYTDITPELEQLGFLGRSAAGAQSS
ncbi:DNA (cytosine-5)-methyltransferase 3-like [Ascaphus truei]|uniref:DNA (cytosine-5)-methyltransferase 3-like n=1 Tax=Ascaphus truei TaxID=8439 RepID=UPI003F5AA0CF